MLIPLSLPPLITESLRVPLFQRRSTALTQLQNRNATILSQAPASACAVPGTSRSNHSSSAQVRLPQVRQPKLRARASSGSSSSPSFEPSSPALPPHPTASTQSNAMAPPAASSATMNWRAAADALLASSGKGAVYLAFLADVDPSTGRSWCPDCVRGQPAIEAGAAAAGAPLLAVWVGPRAVWKDPGHPLRADPGVSGVPTLLEWTKQGAGRRLGSELERAATREDAERLVAAFIKGA